MGSETYEILALAARYWFIALAALFVLRGWRAGAKDNRNSKILRDWAGGSGCVGELVVLEDGVRQKKRSMKGARLPVPSEGLVGSGRTADIRVRHGDLRHRHVWMTYGTGCMWLNPVGRAKVEAPALADGRQILRDGDELCIGKLRMMMVFYDVKDAALGQGEAQQKVRPTVRKEEDEYDDPFEEKFWE